MDQKKAGTPEKPHFWRIIVLVVTKVAQMSITNWIDRKAGSAKK
ncbi:MAG: hypothetical protein ACLQPD_01490 [Desulfomonilaceae bacterium]